MSIWDGYTFDVEDLGEPIVLVPSVAYYFYDRVADRWGLVEGPSPSVWTWAAWLEVA